MEIKPEIEAVAKIKVIGVGGSGGSAVNRMIASRIQGVEFLAANTDAQALHMSQAPVRIHIGKDITKGLGAGMNPEMGAKAAEEAQNEIRDALQGAHMVFITCGLGGGTGTGAAPIIAELAKDIGALTVAVVTKPFSFEGNARRQIAEDGWNKLASKVDSIITVSNDKILQIVDKKTPIKEAFFMADEILQQGVRGVSEVITRVGDVNVDFADVKRIMANTGSAIMGIGHGTGDNRTAEAAKMAISSPLLDHSIDGARAILFTVTGGADLGMLEVSEAAKIITSQADSDATVIFGVQVDDSLGDEVRVTVIATGFDERDKLIKEPAIVDKSINARPSFGVGGSIFNPPFPRTVAAKPVIRREEKRIEETFEATDNDAELEIPAFIRKKMN